MWNWLTFHRISLKNSDMFVFAKNNIEKHRKVSKPTNVLANTENSLPQKAKYVK